jgi:antitoxin FitA
MIALGTTRLMRIADPKMATLTIRNLDAVLKERLRVRAAQHGHSMEAEARQILRDTLREPERRPEPNLYERIRARFAPFGGVGELELPPREPAREPPRFD